MGPAAAVRVWGPGCREAARERRAAWSCHAGTVVWPASLREAQWQTKVRSEGGGARRRRWQRRARTHTRNEVTIFHKKINRLRDGLARETSMLESKARRHLGEPSRRAALRTYATVDVGTTAHGRAFTSLTTSRADQDRRQLGDSGIARVPQPTRPVRGEGGGGVTISQ